jgi:Sec-independent protein translocase protein TatA
MNLFGIGLPEILFILLLALLIFGPKDLEKTGKILGKGLRKLIHSDVWRTIQQTGLEIKNLPTRLMRESGLDEFGTATKRELDQTTRKLNQSIKPEKDE